MIKNNMLNKKVITFVKFSLLSLSFFVLPAISFAETHVYSNITQDLEWNEEGSPYVLEESVYIPSGHKLTIDPGVKVVSATSTDGPYSISFDGDLKVLGTKENPVKFDNLYSLYFSNSNSFISNAVLNQTGLDFSKSTSTIEFTKITNSFNAITAKASHIDVSTSTISNNSYGISSYVYRKFFQFSVTPTLPNDNVATVNKIASIDELDPEQNIISIHGSSITNSSYHAISNQTYNYIDATDNWWGNAYGPSPVDVNGMVVVDPWKVKDPNIVEETCCSNVLFIPGIEASRLYRDEKISSGTSTNRLWEPNSNDDVKALYMDTTGQSIDKTIYTKDVIDVIPGIKLIYKSFIDSMDGLVKSGSINKWLPLPYDWRNGTYDIVTEDVLQKVYDLASTSKTQKIIIISHSNGGLVAKELMKKLEEEGRSDIVENIIFIAVPELGTPEAILSMLHGYNQSIAFGFVLTKNNARTFSQNMPGSYGLIPSRKFFINNPINVISSLFSGNLLVSSFDAMKDFLLNNSFSLSSSTNTNIPITLNSRLFSLSDSLHSTIDLWKPASTTKSLSIFGWGVPTSQGIKYNKDPHCDSSKGKTCGPIFSALIDKAGDGTVLTKSNSGNSSSTLFFDLKKLRHDNIIITSHANILESTDLLNKLKDIIINKKANPNTPASYDKYFSSTEPVDTDKYLTVSVYSPVDIDVYDKDGRHTGASENQILDGYYADYGSVKTVIIPYSPDYQVVLSGNDVGSFIVKAEVSQSDNVIASTTFAELPVTPLMNADFVTGLNVSSFASSTVIDIDMDGDGTTDFVGHSDLFLQSTSTDIIKDIPTYIESIRHTIIALQLSSQVEKDWLNRIDKLSRIINGKNTRKVEKFVKKLSTKRFKTKKITDAQKNLILKMFGDLLSNLEEKYK